MIVGHSQGIAVTSIFVVVKNGKHNVLVAHKKKLTPQVMAWITLKIIISVRRWPSLG